METYFPDFRNQRYPALFTTNDLLVLGAMRLLLDRGVQIPQEVAVLGYDDIELGRMYSPSLSTVSVDTAGIGRDAVELLDKLIRGEADLPKLVEYESHVVKRQSTEGRE